MQKCANLFQNNLPILVAAINPNNATQVAYMSKHWNPKWKRERRQKVIKIKLPSWDDDDDDDPTKLDKEKIRSRMKEHGFLPQKPWQERPAFIGCTSGIFESYVAPEGDGKYSAITKEVYIGFSFLFFILQLVQCVKYTVMYLLVLKRNMKYTFFNCLFYYWNVGSKTKVYILGEKEQVFNGHQKN
jgi:hypothetical protein